MGVRLGHQPSGQQVHQHCMGEYNLYMYAFGLCSLIKNETGARDALSGARAGPRGGSAARRGAAERGSLIVTIHALLLCARPISLSVAARSRPRGVRARRSHRAPVAAARAAGRSRARREPSAREIKRDPGSSQSTVYSKSIL